jgi:hypothetical protein
MASPHPSPTTVARCADGTNPHAEDNFVESFTEHLDRLVGIGVLTKDPDQFNTISVKLNKSPCGKSGHNCSQRLEQFQAELKAKGFNVQLRVKSHNLYHGGGKADGQQALVNLAQVPDVRLGFLDYTRGSAVTKLGFPHERMLLTPEMIGRNALNNYKHYKNLKKVATTHAGAFGGVVTAEARGAARLARELARANNPFKRPRTKVKPAPKKYARK